MPFGSSEGSALVGNVRPDLQFYRIQLADAGVSWLELMSKNMSNDVSGRLVGVSQMAEVHVKVGPDGSLLVPASQLAGAGIHPGDSVVVAPEHRRRVRSMLGVHDRGIDFDVEDQRDIRAEMAAGLGEDLTR